jgi:hypothetical protein
MIDLLCRRTRASAAQQSVASCGALTPHKTRWIHIIKESGNHGIC